MLNKMINNTITDDEYIKCIDWIRYSYWPYDKFNQTNKTAFNKKLRLSKLKERLELLEKEIKEKRLSASDIPDKINDALESFIVDNFYFYKDHCGFSPIPFLDKYHMLFLKRKWIKPYSNPSSHIEDLLRLSYDENNINANYSAHYKNYCHFVNVVAALSHLINYFSNNENSGLLNKYFEDTEYLITIDRQISELISVDKNDKERKIKIMLAGFYHDIGKTVVDHRHAMEGYMILSSYLSGSILDYTALSKEYDCDFDREDLLFIADMVYYHDLYGTLSTGENGYMRLINLIERIERYCRKERKDSPRITNYKDINNELKNRGIKYIFDLWLLNVADIIVSTDEKWVNQEKWTAHAPGNHNINEIKDFFRIDPNNRNNSTLIKQGEDLLHDLKVTINLFGTYIDDQYQNQTSPFKPTVLKCSHYHNIARIRRLIKNTLFPEVDIISKKDENKDILFFYDNILNISKYAIDKTIDTAIRSGADYQDFLKRFSWVGQLDYSLKFFKKLSRTALRIVSKELNILYSDKKDIKYVHTGWITENTHTFNQKKDWQEINARYFVDNYIQIIIQIINHLLFRNTFNEHMLNFEFEDAGNRLTHDKIMRILLFEGPARSTKSTMLILETIFIY